MKRLITALLFGLISVVSAVSAEAQVYTTYYHNDHLGSPVAATDERSELLWRAHFRPYGQRIENPATTSFGTPGYTGHAQDPDSALVYAGARYYDPVIGRFLAIDPVVAQPDIPGSFNRYAYTQNNPYRYTDPDGRWIEDALLGVPSMAMGAASFVSNVNQGNYGSAALDAAGVLVDGLAIATPGVPGGAGYAIQATRAAEKISDVTSIAEKGVGKYEVGAFDVLKSKSVAGDGLDIHHAMQKSPAAQVVEGYNPATAPSMAIPRGEHMRIPTLRGEYTGSARQLLAKDIRDLRNYTNAPNSSLRSLINVNKQMYPGAFGKKGP